MSRLGTRAVVAIITFTIGLALVTLWVARRRLPPAVKVDLEKAPEPETAAQPMTFKNTGVVNLFKVTYLSSDGVSVRYGCFERGTSSRAIKELSQETKKTRVIERTPALDDRGEKVGERVVSAYSDEYYAQAEVRWTEGAKAFVIVSPSLRHAIDFERSRVWVGQGCSDFR